MAKDQSYEAKLRRFLIPILRKRSLYWVGRSEAKKLARRERGFYECNSCKDLFNGSSVEADHIRPVINVKTSFVDWDSFIKSLFCDVSNYQILCRNCHKAKTEVENAARLINKKKKQNANNKNKK